MKHNQKSLNLARQEQLLRRLKIFFRVCAVCFCICLCALLVVTIEAAEAKQKYDFPDGATTVSVYNNGRRILAEESAIIVNAHRINKGELPDLNIKDKDFF